MLVHFLNRSYGHATARRSWLSAGVPLIELPIGDKVLTIHIVEAWCVQRPTGELTGDYANALIAFAAAWRIKP